MNIDIDSVESGSDVKEYPPLPGWVTFPDAAQRLGISKQAFHKIVSNGEIEGVHSVGRKLLVVGEEELAKFIQLREARYRTKQDSVVVSAETMSV